MMATMRGFVYDKASPSSMKMSTDVPTPTADKLKSGQVLVAVRAAGLNPIDYKKPNIPVMNWGLQGKPVASDFSGVVSSVGAGSRFKAGDEVFGFAAVGSMAETIVANDTDMAIKPSTLGFNEAAALPIAYSTSLQSLRDAGGLKAGGRVLVVGASGGCGSAGLSLARALVGPEGTVAAICGTDNVQAVEALGLASPGMVFDYKKPEGLVNLPKDLDLIYDTVSSDHPGDGLGGVPYDQALVKCLKAGSGRTVAINGTGWRFMKALMGFQSKSGSFQIVLCKRSAADLKVLADMIDGGRIGKPTIDSVHALTSEGCEAAYARLKSRRAKGKVVVQVLG